MCTRRELRHQIQLALLIFSVRFLWVSECLYECVCVCVHTFCWIARVQLYGSLFGRCVYFVFIVALCFYVHASTLLFCCFNSDDSPANKYLSIQVIVWLCLFGFVAEQLQYFIAKRVRHRQREPPQQQQQQHRQQKLYCDLSTRVQY